ncbi:transporter [uncultured Algibacter sp.]|uniref:transporter n=1 Tax=uncultured Algibacter sp. TaxID=298659 RepID=UPI002627F028|nr:transporter [uncultured Algibacter sp.]
MKKYLVFLILLTTQTFYAQSGWTKNKGEAYTQLSFTTISGYDTVFGDPEYNTERQVTDNTIQFYSEYGLTDKTTIILNLPIKLIKTGQLVGNTTGITTENSTTNLGNIEIGLKHQFYNKKWAIAGQLNIATNSGSFDNASGIRSGIDAWSFTPTINFSRSFKGFYAQAFTGLDIRTNNYSNNFKIGGEIGTKPFKNVLLIAFIDVVKSLKDGNIALPSSNLLTALYVNDQEYASFGLKAIGEITEKFGANVGFGGAFSGNNVAKKAAITFGVYQKF